MFDREIIKKELQETVGNDVNIDLDEVIDNYTMLDGYYCFRIGYNAHIFQDNTFIDSFPGFFTEKED